ncbi:UDP-N-acetylmuramate dehydrogenase [Thermoactinomyces sp. DSM 45891]|uniref:UDP-N-acetylmuramate dehydrogenase n=1 Tax=Thermoactinomyces sp. DSM 45891 TaxID=1761907 RepID=UPI00092097E1|nr:UDP-N-acetylmuramate dehydrogenase [Thermoactinomyces sp. DSM 45891]SFX26913.1 UDP-N-acetylmuramate dehydrogenase [Thermoactinomyces sp. DSM 45891]
MRKPFVEDLIRVGVQDIKENELLSRHTTWKVGGPADFLINVKTKNELENVMKVIDKHKLPWRVIGRGSNLLVRDGGIRGVVLKLDKGFEYFEFQGTKVIAGGGTSTVMLATKTARQGLTGFEFAGGIPGNIGGAVYMNGGAHGSDVSEVLISAEVLLESGEWVTLSNEQLAFSYRTSVLQKDLRGIVTEATFQLEDGDAVAITDALTRFKDRRRQTQPLQLPCAGSVFRNPAGDFSGRLIEEAGLRGYRIGDAEVSTMHCNFIVNRGQATAQNVLDLIAHVQETIREKYHIELEPEVQVIGEA